MIEGLSHIGIVVANMDRALEVFQKLGFKVEKVQETKSVWQPSYAAKSAFLSAGNVKIELIQPLEQVGRTAEFLAKTGGGLHHLSLAVKDLDGYLKALKDKGVLTEELPPRVGWWGLREVFLPTKNVENVILELDETELK